MGLLIIASIFNTSHESTQLKTNTISAVCAGAEHSVLWNLWFEINTFQLQLKDVFGR